MKELMNKLRSQEASIGIVGLGYVGLPLAALLAAKYKVIGFDINQRRVDELKKGIDRTNEVEDSKKLSQQSLSYTTDPKMLGQCSIIIVAVPTPIDNFKKPDLTPVISASTTVGSVMKPGTIVVYESTVYPGLTEKDCRDVLVKTSGLTYNKDFYLGYSPERVNPGDRVNTIDKIVKIVSGSTPDVLNVLADLYGSVIKAGIHRAPNIATAEAAKIVENVQRDVNISLMNELSQIFERVGLDTLDVLQAAGTKWNFLPFRPGLVGGHCIGVDPYYLTYLAEGVGVQPHVINSGRHVNDNMGRFIARKTVRMVLENRTSPSTKINIGVLGVTFKENVPDLRNTKVMNVVEEFDSYGIKAHLIDPIADPEEFFHEYGRRLTSWQELPMCDAIIIAVKHDIFQHEYPLPKLLEKLNDAKVVIDVKGSYCREKAADLGMKLWRP